ncbi:GntR family transcriptional regulator [Massilia varians]|uniref:GntR family transcriptional regulator n=1 Tax=Massilia sp. LC238 TaxID=1502852 RepID=UPI0004E35B8D|nr:GntR family transcriptional regulator [Massilia sp. LC238]KFC65586.1 putative GntR-family regulatory protein and aminotransferase near polyamine transporter [Massilia sp. LC238]
MSRRTPLMLNIATGDTRPINRQIVDGVRRLIASGELEVGALLPSVRGLAQQLSINPNTVAKAYGELTLEGWVESRAGLGLFVLQPRQLLSDAERERRLGEAVDRFTGDVIGLGYSDTDILDRVAGELAACLPRKVA